LRVTAREIEIAGTNSALLHSGMKDRSIWQWSNWGLVVPLSVGTFCFFTIVGSRILRSGNIAWLDVGDSAAQFLGWHFFRESPWSFPLGLNPRYGLEISNSIVFSDSIPLLAFLFKPFADFLPETFQYFGFWLYGCFLLQAWFSWKLASLVTHDVAIRALATGLFVFSPPMIMRLSFGHLALVGHFFIVAALYLCLRPIEERRTWPWICLLTLAALVNAYLLGMVAVLWLADLLGIVLRKVRSVEYALQEVIWASFFVGLACWQAGYFTVGKGTIASGFGFYRMNLLSIIDSNGWSYVVRDLPGAEGDYEGFNFLGLGVILAGIFAIPALLKSRRDLLIIATKRPVLSIALLGFMIYALSNNIGIGSANIRLPVPERILTAATVFRSSGRMFWPVFYAIIFAIICIIIRDYEIRVARYLLGVALVVQATDTSAAWLDIRKRLMTEPATEWISPLKDSFWNQAAAKYHKVRWIVPGQSTHWQTFASYAARNGMATDAVYLNRVGRVQLNGAREKAMFALQTGNFEGDSLYILDTDSMGQVVGHLDRSVDLLARIDGFIVLAPAWKKCDKCSAVVDEISLGNLNAPSVIHR
jgi:Family of unknown function (DUF6311)